MSAAQSSRRDRRPGWKPPEFLTTPPVFVWPPRPGKFVKWFFGFPGYLWPWNLAYAVIATATWMFLTPDMARMQTMQVDWIAFLFARNLIILVAIISAWHLRLYVQKAQDLDYKYSGRWLAKGNSAFLFGNQVLDNVFWTIVSAVPIWTAYEVLTLWAQANGYIPYVSWREHPIYCALLMLAIPLIREMHFYLVHRLIHWPPLYRTVHSLHHNNVNPGPWSGLAMHPVEHVLYFSCVLVHWIIPSSPLHAIYNLQHLAFAPSQGHSGFGKIVLADGVEMDNGNYFHYLHHRYFEVNYGGDGLVPMDRWFGTFHDGSDEAEVAMNKRVLTKTQ